MPKNKSTESSTISNRQGEPFYFQTWTHQFIIDVLLFHIPPGKLQSLPGFIQKRCFQAFRVVSLCVWNVFFC